MSEHGNEVMLPGVKHKILVLSGKGGVGKSTVAVNLAAGLALQGHAVGLLDVDIHGPSVPVLLGLEDAKVEQLGDKMLPVRHAGMLVMSVGFLLGDKDDAVIWRGPMKAGVIRQFLEQVEWGELDYLVVDSPPGTGDEPLSICQHLPGARALIVTTPQAVAAADVRKSVTFCNKLEMPVAGVVENMGGFVCPHCGTVTDIFKSGGGKKIADKFGIPFIGTLPIDPDIGEAGEDGEPFIRRHAGSPLAAAFQPVLDAVIAGNKQAAPSAAKETVMRKIALPVVGGKLNLHFGHCDAFSVFSIDASGAIAGREELAAPPHEPGLLPRFLHERGVTDIIAGGMGQRAQDLFRENGIKVCVGASGDPEALVRQYLAGTLVSGVNACDH